MKRNYVTPVIVMETFNVTQSIAACGTKFNFLNRECVLKDSDATKNMMSFAYWGYFMENHCDNSYFEVGTGEQEDGFCYHTNANAAFNS